MNRPIKFRAWDTLMNEWLRAPFFVNPDTGNVHAWSELGLEGYDLPSVSLMQSTGLKDKNGVEIFESDILRYQPSTGEEYDDLYLVEWFEHGFSAIWYKNGLAQRKGVDGLTDCDQDMAVVGNLHENAELLSSGGAS